MWNLNLLRLSHSLSQVKPSPTNPELHTQVKLEFTTLSLEHMAFTSQGLDWHGSGTKQTQIENLLRLSHLLSQENPSPTNPELHTQVKLEFITLSLEHMAFTSQGLDWHGSGTEQTEIECEIWICYV